MSDDQLAHAQDYIWRNARLLERQLFAYLFGNGQRDSVLAVLRAYQNDDGGFGNALESDKRCPASQPVDVEMALRILDYVDGFGTPMVGRACNSLEAISTPEGGVPFALPSVMDYPRAPWWNVPANPPAALNPTAAILGLLLKRGVEHPWLGRATEFCWRAIAESNTRQYHDLMPMIAFLKHAPDRQRAERELERIAARILEPGVVAYDVAAMGYVKKPLDWAPTPDSFCRRLFSDAVIAEHLAALAAQQQPDGGWLINWEPLSPGVELEWRGWRTIETLRTLRAYRT